MTRVTHHSLLFLVIKYIQLITLRHTTAVTLMRLSSAIEEKLVIAGLRYATNKRLAGDGE